MKKISLIILPFLATTIYANQNPDVTTGMKQRVQICAGVNGDSSADGFKVGFTSSDAFDHTRWTKNVVTGTDCVDHTYHHGPKNIKLKVEAKDNGNPRYVKVVPDGSCDFMKGNGEAKFESNYVGTSKANATQIWNFSLIQAAPEDGYRYVYNMSCEHIAR